MNANDQNTLYAAEEQAALWAARLEGATLSAEAEALLQAWLAASPSHPALLANYRQFSSVLDRQLPALVAAGAVALPPQPVPASGRGLRGWLTFGALATAAAAAVSVWMVRSGRESASFVTPPGQRQSLTLADGSRVDLNAHTTLMVEEGGRERRVRLTDGEAFFVVAKDKSRPFIVETPAGSVRVTGTIFDVRSENPSQLEVTVVEGLVQVRSGSARETAPVSLHAGGRFSTAKAGVSLQTLSPAEVDDAIAWRKGQIVFDGVPLGDALGRFAHYHERSITAAADTAQVRVGGRFDLDDLDGFLAGLERMLPVRVKHESGGAIQVQLRAAP